MKSIMKAFYLTLVLALLVFSFGCDGAPAPDGEAGAENGEEAETFRIGIMQIADHPALNAARDGFIEALAGEGFVDGENISLDLHNAYGDITTASTIAEGFVADEADLILAIATDSAEAAYNATKEIPILITAVTDPVAAGLAESLEAPGTNVTGTHDMNPIKEQLALLKELFPEVKTVGVIFNSGEINSQVQVEIIEELAPGLGLEIVKAAATTTGEVGTAAESLVGSADAIYVPTDNTVVSAIGSVIKVSEEHLIPVIPGDENSVREGALATLGLDYYKLGYQTGQMAAKILRGEAEPATTPIEGQLEYSVVINKNALEMFHLDLPQDLLDQATLVE